MTKTKIVLAIILTFGLIGWGLDTEVESQNELLQDTPNQVAGSSVNTGPLPEGCVKFEDGAIGVEGLSVSFCGVTLTIDSWTTKDDEPHEYIGFEYTVMGGSVWVSVNAGNDIFQADGTGSWHNPNGTAGPEVSAISNIVFCCDG